MTGNVFYFLHFFLYLVKMNKSKNIICGGKNTLPTSNNCKFYVVINSNMSCYELLEY